LASNNLYDYHFYMTTIDNLYFLFVFNALKVCNEKMK